MRIDAPAFRQHARFALMGIILSLHASASIAGPEETFDPILRLLADKGSGTESAPAVDPAAAGPRLLGEVQRRRHRPFGPALLRVGTRGTIGTWPTK